MASHPWGEVAARLRSLLRRPDFQDRPVRAVCRRIYWRLRWRVSERPWIHRLSPDLWIEFPRCGAGALMYYQGHSAPDTAAFIRTYLRPGMTFADVGAHLGEYTLLAARAVAPGGLVCAFEPNPEIFKFLEANVRRNDVDVELNRSGVCDRAGTREFEIHAEPAMSAMKAAPLESTRPDVIRRMAVPTVALDDVAALLPRKIDLIKIDVEGAELMVLKGAATLLAEPSDRAPALVFEFAPHNYARFGYEGAAVIEFLQSHGYELGMWRRGRFERWVAPVSMAEATLDLVATKDPDRLARLGTAAR